jgi:hypothetical protein
MNKIIITAHRDKYSADEVRSMTAEDLICILSQFDPYAKIVLSFDGGYTYGGILDEDIEEIEEDEEEEEEC